MLELILDAFTNESNENLLKNFIENNDPNDLSNYHYTTENYLIFNRSATNNIVHSLHEYLYMLHDLDGGTIDFFKAFVQILYVIEFI